MTLTGLGVAAVSLRLQRRTRASRVVVSMNKKAEKADRTNNPVRNDV
jgi:DHA1 family chloramphenicol resistance protein-like MFS transporter